jgi:predicted nucleic acid-binding protein
VSEIWVVNASPLIALAKIGRLDVLTDAGREIVVPSAVAREVLAGPADDAAAVAVRGPLAGLVVDHLDLASVIEWGLGAGETAVLSVAIGRSAKAVVDDREARSAASALKVPTLGTLGAVILARAEGRISSAAELLRRLREAGLRLVDGLVRSALARLVGESLPL